MRLDKDTLKQVFVGTGIIPEAAFNDAAKSAEELGKRLEDVLIFRGLVTQDAFSKAIAEHFKVPFVNVGKIAIPDGVLALVPEKLARTYRLIPLEKEGQTLKV